MITLPSRRNWANAILEIGISGGNMSRERLDEIPSAIGTPTIFPTELNKHALRCDGCERLFYVDGGMYDRVHHALEFDPANNPFRCPDCEEEYEESAFLSRTN